MAVTVAVLYKGALACYAVSRTGEERYEAYLLKYNGKEQDRPPHMVQFVKQGRHCSGDTGEQELMDELCYVVREKEASCTWMDTIRNTYVGINFY
jgi:hypothetical protein